MIHQSENYVRFLHENVRAFSTVSHSFKDEHFKTVLIGEELFVLVNHV